jgi:phage terminase large subunit-like protein
MFDESKASRAVKFIEALKLTGDFHGQPFRLMDWQRSLVRDVFGTVRENGLRVYRHVYVEIPKKNAKSQLASALGLLQLYNKDEPNGEIVLAAGDREQARKDLYAPLVEMIEQEPALIKRVRIIDSLREIINVETGTKLKVISHEAYTKHGWNISFALIDELHAFPTRDLYDVLTHGAGMARRQPLWMILTTAGDDPDRRSICWEQHEIAKKIITARQSGDTENDIPEWYPVIYSYEGDDIYNPENWKKANPSLGVTFPIETMQSLANEAKLNPSKERLFRWLNLNQWLTTKLTGWLPLDLFDSTVGDWSRGDLLGLDCFLGGDFSTTTDLSAICLVFPPQEKDGKILDDWRVIWDCWIPRDTMLERAREDHVPYDIWASEGWIHPTDGNQIDYDTIEERIWELSNLYNIRECGMDLSFATMLIQHLQKNAPRENWVVETPQTYARMTDPINYIEILLRQKRTVYLDGTETIAPMLTHENHPVARWCFGNASIATNGNGQKKLVKQHKGRGLDRTKRIDLIIAFVNAMARASLYEHADLQAIMDDDWGM